MPCRLAAAECLLAEEGAVLVAIDDLHQRGQIDGRRRGTVSVPLEIGAHPVEAPEARGAHDSPPRESNDDVSGGRGGRQSSLDEVHHEVATQQNANGHGPGRTTL